MSIARESEGMPHGVELIGAAVAAAAVAFVGLRLHMLDQGGAVAATVVGWAIFGFGGWRLAMLLVLFFGTSSLLTRYRRKEKPQPEHRRGRSALQVLANGSIPALLAVGHYAFGWLSALPAAAGALASSTADTWATEVGLLSTSPPRMITNGRVVERGRSGAVTVLGTISGVAGALMIGVSAAVLFRRSPWPLVAAGSAGLLVDSLLGATVQAAYLCPSCGRSTESPECDCGGTAELVQGLRWMTNDTVNLLAAIVGAGVAAFLQ